MSAPDLSRTVRPRTSRSLRTQGISKHLLEGPRYRRTSPGRYVPAVVPPTTAQRLVEAAAHLPPGGALGGWSAAHLLGATALDGVDGAGRPEPVVACVPDALHRRLAPGLRYVRQDLRPEEVVDVCGLAVTSALRTAGDLARWAHSAEEAVVRLDLLLQAGVIAEADLIACAARLGGRRGTRQARDALALARAGSRSPGETRLRLAYVLETGAPDPLLNPVLLDAGGRVLGMPDLLDPEAGLVLEYDGARWDDPARPDGHLDPGQHREDNVRHEAFERHGLLVLRAARADLGQHRRQLTVRMLAARAEGLRRGSAGWTWQLAPDRYLVPVRRSR